DLAVADGRRPMSRSVLAYGAATLRPGARRSGPTSSPLELSCEQCPPDAGVKPEETPERAAPRPVSGRREVDPRAERAAPGRPEGARGQAPRPLGRAPAQITASSSCP